MPLAIPLALDREGATMGMTDAPIDYGKPLVRSAASVTDEGHLISSLSLIALKIASAT